MHSLRRALAAVSVTVLAGTLMGVPAQAEPSRTTQADRVVPGLRQAGGSVLGFQCGPGVCLVDPDARGAQPVRVVPEGRFAGVTADGRTVAWVQGEQLMAAPTSGGVPQTIHTGFVGNAPVISPDGAHVLWDYGVPVYGYTYTMRLTVATGEVTGVAAVSGVTTWGWAGSRAIAALPPSGAEPSQICWIGTDAETGTSDSCGAVLVSEAGGALSFPDGTADGQSYVASVDPRNPEVGGSEGPLVLFSGATGARVKALTSHPTDTTPTFSQAGDRVAFERDGTIMVVDVTTGAERAVAPGVYPSWGGVVSGGPGGPGGPGGAAGTIRVKGAKATLKRGKVVVRLTCRGAGPCRGSAVLGTGKGRRAKVFAKRAYGVRAGKAGTVKLTLTKAGRKRFRGDGRVRLTLTLRPAAGGKVVTRKVVVRY